MTFKATATGWIRDLAGRRWDASLAGHGFTRPANALAWTRAVTDGRQRLHLDLAVRSGIVQLTLRASIAFPAVARIGAELFGPHASGYGKSGTVHIAPLDLVAPGGSMMLFSSAEQLEDLAPAVERRLTGALIPYLDGLTSVVALTEAQRRELVAPDDLPGYVGRLPVMVTAGYLAMGRAAEALRILRTAYPVGTPGRELYGRAIVVAEKAA